MYEYRIEHDTMGELRVPAERLWGAQTERSLENFWIGTEEIPRELIRALALLKYAAAEANEELGMLDQPRAKCIRDACRDIIDGKYSKEFPLKVWQTGSGTQSNMNMNEVISHIAMRADPGIEMHPNDHVNRSQSSNDIFPSAMHVAAFLGIRESLLPAADGLIESMKRLEEENRELIKIGRTHLQDAVPLRFSQEISGWRGMLEESREQILESSERLRRLAVGGTAVGTGLNCLEGFDRLCCESLSRLTGESFSPEPNKFHALSAKDSYSYLSGALRTLAANLMKIANDVRWLSSGPRCGLCEISIPENEPGSSIMPGKVNPTQCEAITMIAIQVMGNDVTIGMGASQGNFELNVFMPVLAYNMMQSIRLLSDGMLSFDRHCVSGIRAKRENMEEKLQRSLMLVTCLSPRIGYENAAKCAHKALEEGISLKEAVTALGFLDASEYEEAVRPERML